MAHKDDDQELHHYAVPLGVEHHYFIDFNLRGAEVFHDFFTCLRQAGPDDIVYIHLNSDGGSIDTMVQIIHSINSTQATVVGCAEGSVASAAAFIFFSCHAFQIADHCEFLIHNGSGGQVGKPNDNVAYANSHHKRIEGVVKRTAGKFLKKKDIAAILNGKELFLTSEEVSERIAKTIEKYDRQQEEQEDVE